LQASVRSRYPGQNGFDSLEEHNAKSISGILVTSRAINCTILALEAERYRGLSGTRTRFRAYVQITSVTSSHVQYINVKPNTPTIMPRFYFRGALPLTQAIVESRNWSSDPPNNELKIREPDRPVLLKRA